MLPETVMLNCWPAIVTFPDPDATTAAPMLTVLVPAPALTVKLRLADIVKELFTETLPPLVRLTFAPVPDLPGVLIAELTVIEGIGRVASIDRKCVARCHEVGLFERSTTEPRRVIATGCIVTKRGYVGSSRWQVENDIA